MDEIEGEAVIVVDQRDALHPGSRAKASRLFRRGAAPVKLSRQCRGERCFVERNCDCLRDAQRADGGACSLSVSNAVGKRKGKRRSPHVTTFARKLALAVATRA